MELTVLVDLADSWKLRGFFTSAFTSWCINGVYGCLELLSHILEVPQHQAALGDDGKEVQHLEERTPVRVLGLGLGLELWVSVWAAQTLDFLLTSYAVNMRKNGRCSFN
ncbi:hypothetical protein E2C01_011168 [Portunus trituberculatus]|uniref:Uncharacterized protein n=1 Tax=Portunus trituberculatus TaxID=210409 RepID=A0A5B7DAE8_PORTR|nr:hypothetical protein [Portunus trituberculatus]